MSDTAAEPRTEADRKAELETFGESLGDAFLDRFGPFLIDVASGRAVPAIRIRGTVGGAKVDLVIEPETSARIEATGGSETGSGTIELPDD